MIELSGEMRRRGAIVRALALGLPILLMNQPVGALEALNRACLQDLLLTVWQRAIPRKTILIFARAIEEALDLSGRAAVLGAAPGWVIRGFDRPHDRRGLFAFPIFQQLRQVLADALRADALVHLN